MVFHTDFRSQEVLFYQLPGNYLSVDKVFRDFKLLYRVAVWVCKVGSLEGGSDSIFNNHTILRVVRKVVMFHSWSFMLLISPNIDCYEFIVFLT